MSTDASVASPPCPPHPRAINLALIGVFTGTIFLSALLLFSVQPMFAKMVLPLLGGSPSVLVGGDGVLSRRVAAWLCLCACADALSRSAPSR